MKDFLGATKATDIGWDTDTDAAQRQVDNVNLCPKQVVYAFVLTSLKGTANTLE